MLEKLKLELVPAAGNKLVLKLSPPPLPLADMQVSLAGNTTVNPPRGEAAGIQSEGELASIEDVFLSEGEPASLGVVFAASVGATFDSCAKASRRLTFTVDKTSCPPPPSLPPFVIDAAGGKADSISSEKEPASFKDVIGDGGGTAAASEGESAPMAPAKACGAKNDVVKGASLDESVLKKDLAAATAPAAEVDSDLAKAMRAVDQPSANAVFWSKLARPNPPAIGVTKNAAPALKPVTKDAPTLEPVTAGGAPLPSIKEFPEKPAPAGDADWTVSAKEKSVPGISEWTTPSKSRRNNERKGASAPVDCSNGYGALLGAGGTEGSGSGTGKRSKVTRGSTQSTANAGATVIIEATTITTPEGYATGWFSWPKICPLRLFGILALIGFGAAFAHYSYSATTALLSSQRCDSPDDIFKSPAEYCKSCPPNADCPVNTTLVSLGIPAGFWRASPSSAVLTACRDFGGDRAGEARCVGNERGAKQGSRLLEEAGSDEYCASGLTGPECQLCAAENHFLVDGDDCKECAPRGAAAALTAGMFFALCAVCGLAAWAYSRPQISDVMLGLGRRHVLLLLGLTAGQVAARHAILPNDEPALTDRRDYTVDTASSADMASPMETAKIFVTLRSPTTQLVVFSPDRMPIDRSKIAAAQANKTVYKLLLMQRACKMTSGSRSASSCYEEPFDVRKPDSPDRAFEFYRFGGTGGAGPNDMLMMEASAAMPNGTALPQQWRRKGFRGCPKLEMQCNNHRAVSMRSGSPSTLKKYPSMDWSNVIYNDAEFMETLIFKTPPNYTDAAEATRCAHRAGACQWTPQSIEFLQEVLPLANGFEKARKREGQWLGVYHSYKRLPTHAEYLHFLRNRRREMSVVSMSLIAAGDVADYPRNVTAALKRTFGRVTGVPSFAVQIRVASASVSLRVRIYSVSAASAANVSAALTTSLASPASASAALGISVVTVSNVTVRDPTASAQTGGGATSGGATSGGGGSGGGGGGAGAGGSYAYDPPPPPDAGSGDPDSGSGTGGGGGGGGGGSSSRAYGGGDRRRAEEQLLPPSTAGSSSSPPRRTDGKHEEAEPWPDGANLLDEADGAWDEEWVVPDDDELEEELRLEEALRAEEATRRRELRSSSDYEYESEYEYEYEYGGDEDTSDGDDMSYGDGGDASLWDDSYGEDALELPEGVDASVGTLDRAPKISPTAGEQLHPNNINIVRGRWDHHIEVCAFEGECTADTAACVNNYGVALVTADLPNQPEANVLYQTYKQFPTEGAGDLLALRATPEQGPFAPCPVGDDGRQVPCAPPAMMYRGARITGFVPPNPMHFYVDAIKVAKVNEIAAGSFTLTLAYDIAWSDRYAVHPCKIPLYSYGKGVPATGKLVPSSKWWKPDPDKGDNAALSFRHSPNLKVHHTASTADEVGRPGALVTRACRPSSCPWPKQLFLRDQITAEVRVAVTWDYTQYPFDRQMMRMTLPLLDAEGFTSYDVASAHLNVALPEAEALAAAVGNLYKPADWRVYALDVSYDAPHHLTVSVKIARNSMATVFKAVIPMAANGLLLMLATRLEISKRLQVLSLSMVVAGSMLNPAFLGLPATVSGIPFLQSLVIIHMVVASLILCYTICLFATDWLYEDRVEAHQRAYGKSMTGVWKQHADTFTKWSKAVQEAADAQGAAADAPPAPGFGDATFFKQFEKTPAHGKGSTGLFRRRLGAKTAPATTTLPTTAPGAGGAPGPVEQLGPSAVHLALAPSSSSNAAVPAAAGAPATTAVAHAAEPEQATKAEKPGKDEGEGGLSAASLQRATVELLLGLPALFHRQDPTRPPTIFNPFGELRPGHLPEYNRWLLLRSGNQKKMEALVPAVLIFLWTLDIIVYFVVTDGEPS